MSSRRVGSWGCMVVALVLAGSTVWGAVASKSYVLVVPERFRMVQFGADVSAMCGVPLLTYDAGTLSMDGGLRLFSWSPSQQLWRPLDADSFGMHVGEGRLGTVLLVGREADLPAELTDALTGTPVARINTMDLSQVANALHAHLGFSSRQWKSLAARHGLKLMDRNAAKRQYGRYGRSPQVPAPEAVVPEIRSSQPAAMGPVRVFGSQAEEVTIDVVEPRSEEVTLSIPEPEPESRVAEPEPEAVEVPEAPPVTVAPEPIEKGERIHVAPEELPEPQMEVAPEPDEAVAVLPQGPEPEAEDK